MTREEAIEELKAILEMDYKNVPLSKAALEKAIKALEQLDKIKQIVKECQDNKLFTGDAVFEICEVLRNDKRTS